MLDFLLVSASKTILRPTPRDYPPTLRWQTASHWLVHLQAQRQSGITDYNGYLQTGNGSLVPYRASTGNTAHQISLAAGYAVNASNWPALPGRVQITPITVALNAGCRRCKSNF